MTWLLLAEAAVPEGGLFDLDATLPLMAVQVVLLTFLLNSLFFRPVGKVVEDREGFISTSRADAKQKLAQVERLEADLAEQLKGARQAVQSVIVDAVGETVKTSRLQYGDERTGVLLQAATAEEGHGSLPGLKAGCTAEY